MCPLTHFAQSAERFFLLCSAKGQSQQQAQSSFCTFTCATITTCTGCSGVARPFASRRHGTQHRNQKISKKQHYCMLFCCPRSEAQKIHKRSAQMLVVLAPKGHSRCNLDGQVLYAQATQGRIGGTCNIFHGKEEAQSTPMPF